ncbi:MAG TPA: LysM peptidoglycan-binding domain-containing protein, partial [Aequorivita sp.]|nr:LysM peptidoglycan-binding domain-containing protein [Aequorivita sp.]
MFRFFIYITFIALLTASCGSAAQQQYTSHAVKKGETVYSIAKDYNISEATLYNLNPDARKGLKVNSILILPGKDIVGGGINKQKQRTHEVKRQETLYGIAQLYNVSVDDIKKLNKELYSRDLKSGETLIIPTKSSQNGMINPNIGGLSPGTALYVVKPKETKFGIARKFGITLAELEDLNPDLGEELKVGAEIIVPEEAVVENGQMDAENY